MMDKAWGEHVPTADDVANMAPIFKSQMAAS